jgi:glycosidase
VTPLAKQRLDANSYFNHYKKVIALRQANPALAIGSLAATGLTYPNSVMAFVRHSAGQELFVLHHLGAEAVEVALPEGFKSTRYATEGVMLRSGKVLLPPNSSLVLERNP